MADATLTDDERLILETLEKVYSDSDVAAGAFDTISLEPEDIAAETALADVEVERLLLSLIQRRYVGVHEVVNVPNRYYLTESGHQGLQ